MGLNYKHVKTMSERLLASAMSTMDEGSKTAISVMLVAHSVKTFTMCFLPVQCWAGLMPT